MASTRIPFDEAYTVVRSATERLGITGDRGDLCARLFVEATRDGVYSHGMERFPTFARAVADGLVDVTARPRRVSGGGAIERWDGCRGPGNLNAWSAMDRAMALAREHGVGAVSLGNTNHWMRGGSYGWQAADAGLLALCWSNTLPNTSAAGEPPAVGNNPLVVALPRSAGPLVLDMALSQFSVGVMTGYAQRGERLPVPGGFTAAGELTDVAADVVGGGHGAAIGRWKGFALAVVLDAWAAMLSGGRATHELGQDPARESGQTQFFLAVDPDAVGAPGEREQMVDGIVAALKQAPGADGSELRYPGEGTFRTRAENLAHGLPVRRATWEALTSAGAPPAQGTEDGGAQGQ
ncbi:Ldh family oxidoreductase [Georgenia sp. H159]|uniref:Ldh family oxidoreductase n=1 Tax=Georgenia sp. H159 TaxID=3076115 RepID=UPI002D796A0E|nr:Ldh family oxidoreductase [Georgenia sp. H159]